MLYDKKTKRIVNNESDEIIRMLNEQAGALGSTYSDHPNLYPQRLKDQIDELNAEIYTSINNGAYKAGIAI